MWCGPWDSGLPIDAVQLVETREDVAQLLAMDTYIDVRHDDCHASMQWDVLAAVLVQES